MFSIINLPRVQVQNRKPNTTKQVQDHGKVILDGFHLNGPTSGFVCMQQNNQCHLRLPA